ncbi:MAG TPA: LuxR C-terminal-related transcriptional regulator, partial [Acidimicrobiales bacterium]
EEALDDEPKPELELEGEAIDDALSAVGNFADLASPYLVGHSAGVADLAEAAAPQRRFSEVDVTAAYRAALVHDVGRVAAPVRIWQKEGPLSADDWERVRLHAYHSERILARSPFLARTRLHRKPPPRASRRIGLPPGRACPGPLAVGAGLAACDSYHAMTEPRPHRGPRAPAQAADLLMEEAQAGRLDVDAVAAVIEAAGRPKPRLDRPAGLTDREVQVVGLLARGCQTKQIARTLGISAKTTDRHVQNAYGKIGVSTRAGAALFAMEHGLATWGELPMGSPRADP